jgi:hypothetical protein
MTAQISDTIIYPSLGNYREDASEREWAIAGVAGESLFDPAPHQLKVQSSSTGCRRGYHCGYLVSNGELRLTRVTCGLRHNDVEAIGRGAGPKLFGAPLRTRFQLTQAFDPKTGRLGPQELTPAGDYQVEGLSAPLDFTGGLLLGRDFIQELYVHIGFQPVYRYRTVTELTFEHGRLQNAQDHSDAVAAYRARLSKGTEQPMRPWYLRWFRPDPEEPIPALPFAHRY